MLKTNQQKLAAALTILMVMPGTIWGQAAPQEPVFVPGARPAGGIKILILEGNRGANRLKDGLYAVPVVEVRDSNDLPVEGAKVTFRLPAGGPGAIFPGGSTEKTFSTNAQGQAMADGYQPNNLEGRFVVMVNAVYAEDKASIEIPQSNTFQTAAAADRDKRGSKRKWIWIGVAAAGGATALAILLTRGNSATVATGPTRVGVGVGPIVITGN